MKHHVLMRALLVLVVAFLFGVADALIKGHHGGTRNAVGNISAPWALIPLLGGVFVLPHRLSRGVVFGATSIVAALASYPIVRIIAFHTGSTNGRTHSDLFAAAGNRWLLLGLIGGMMLGGAGSLLAARRNWNLVTWVAAAMFVLEPFARILWAIARGNPARISVPNPTIWSLEIFCGCALLAGYHLLRVGRRQNRPAADVES